MIDIKFDFKRFNNQIEGLVGNRFNTLLELQDYIKLKTNLCVKLQLSECNEDDLLEGYDERIVSNCTVNGYDLCYLDIYYLKDNSGKFYITEVCTDFNT